MLALSACGGGGNDSNPNALIFPQVPPPEEVKGLACQDLNGNPTIVKPKTVAIRNNSDSPIYPVLTIGWPGHQLVHRDASRR